MKTAVVHTRKGLTLIQTMLIVAIVGILASVAIPAIQDYVVRMKVREAVRSAHPARTALYLRPARRRPNLRIVTGAHVHRLCFEGRRAVGVRYAVGAEAHEARARVEVLLCAGAIGSPQILQLSGVGPGDLLGQHGIETLHDLPGVGGNLQDHLQLRAVYKCTRPTLNDEVNNPLRKMLIGIEYILKRTGPMSMGASQVYAFARTRAARG